VVQRELDEGFSNIVWDVVPHRSLPRRTVGKSIKSRGSVENLNKRVRRYLPRDTQLAALSNRNIKAICDRLNATSRKCLGLKTPAEVFREKMMKEMGRRPYPQKS